MSRINQGVILMISLLFILSSCSRTKETYYPNGTIKSEQTYKGKKLEGMSTWYFDNGSKELEIAYIDNKPNGKSTRWYYSGKKESEETYVDGKKTGPSKKWDPESNLIEEINYLNDSLNGPYVMYYEDGQIQIEGFYKMGLFDSIWSYYEVTGMKVGDGKYKNGKGEQRAFFPNGKLWRIIPYENNKRNGTEIWYNQLGVESKRIEYKNDIPVIQK